MPRRIPLRDRCKTCTVRGVCPNCPVSRQEAYMQTLVDPHRARCITVRELRAALETLPQGARVRFIETTNPEAYAHDVEAAETVASWRKRMNHPEAAVRVAVSGLRLNEVVLSGPMR